MSNNVEATVDRGLRQFMTKIAVFAYGTMQQSPSIAVGSMAGRLITGLSPRAKQAHAHIYS